MKIKVSEAQGPALDWLVAKLEEAHDRCLTKVVPSNTIGHFVWREVEYDSAPNFGWWAPSRIWSQGGPIIEREQIAIVPMAAGWEAQFEPTTDEPLFLSYGPTPLIAAMRCFVVSKLGEEVEIPNELVKG